MAKLDTSILTGLAFSIDTYDPDVATVESIKELLGQLRLSRQLETGFESILVRTLDEFADNGDILSPEDTLMNSGLMSPGAAKKVTRRRKAGKALPALGDALDSGSAPTENLDAIAAAYNRLDDDAKERFGAVQDEVIKKAKILPPNLFGPYLKTEIEHAKQDFGLSEYEQQVKDSTLSYGVNKKTGMAYLRGSIDPVRGEQIITSLDAMIRKLAKESDNKTSFGEQLKIDALVALCTQKPNGQSSATTSFGVIVDAETLLNGPHKNSVRETRDFGTSLSQPTIERLACDCQIHTLLRDANGVVTDVGRTYRSATKAQRLALRAMYGSTCGVVGCDTAFAWCQIHHITPWEHNGPTDLNNLIPLCSEHHHKVHEGGWSIHLDEARNLTITRPDGSVFQVQQLPSKPDPGRSKRRSSSPPGKRIAA